jgi:hypothetical protein
MECSLKLPICFFWDSWVYGVQVWDFFDSPHDHDAWNRLLWNRHGKVFGSGRSIGLILSIDSQLGSSTRLSCVDSYMHRVV